jgi:predicted DNA-binding transcriptional regulator YafY
MSRSQRLLALLQALRRHRRPVTARDLAGELGVSVRTVYRDIGTLVQQGAPIEGEAGLGYLLRPGFVLPPLMFQDEEIEALVLGARWVAQQPDAALSRAAVDVVAKIQSVLPERLRSRVEDAGLFAVPRTPLAQDAVDLGVLRAAIRSQHRLSLVYRDEGGCQTDRAVWPMALAFFEQVRVLIAWCELRRAFRHFRTDRILSATTSGDRYPRPRAALLAEWRVENGITADRI